LTKVDRHRNHGRRTLDRAPLCGPHELRKPPARLEDSKRSALLLDPVSRSLTVACEIAV